MAELAILDMNGRPTGSVDVPEILAGGEVNSSVLHQVVVAHLANQRQGNSSSKTRGEVQGSGKKLFRQKGLGRARVGSSRSPMRVGGGVAFGPRPRSFRQATPKKMRRLALLSALRDKVTQGSVIVAQEIPGDRAVPRTQAIVKFLARLNVSNRKVAIVLAELDAWVVQSSRNLKNVTVTTSGLLHAYDVVTHDVLVVVPDALDGLAGRLGGRSEEAVADVVVEAEVS